MQTFAYTICQHVSVSQVHETISHGGVQFQRCLNTSKWQGFQVPYSLATTVAKPHLNSGEVQRG